MRHSWMKRTVAFAVSLLLCAQPVMAGSLPQGVETEAPDGGVTAEETVTGISETEQTEDDAANVEEKVAPKEEISGTDEDGDGDGVIDHEYETIYPSTVATSKKLYSLASIDGILKEGQHAKWIDRINDEVSFYGDFKSNIYDQLSVEDFWMDDSNFSPDDSTPHNDYSTVKHVEFNFNRGKPEERHEETVCIKVAETTIDKEELVDDYIFAMMSALDRDFPQIFWNSGAVEFRGKEYEDLNRYDVYIVLASETTYPNKPEPNTTFDMRRSDYSSSSLILSEIAKRDQYVETIINSAADKTSNYEKIQCFDNWLTHHNQYNTIVAGSSGKPATDDPWECISALEGREGENGPVCEGYARAFKVLCDKAKIPCILVSGMAASTPDGAEGAHMWNYVQLDEKWYAVDVTWDDPSSGSGVESGHENQEYLCVGANTTNEKGISFSSSHRVTDSVFPNGPDSTQNVPKLNSDKYEPGSSKEKPSIDNDSYPITYTYNGSSITEPKSSDFTVNGVKDEDNVSFQWYKGKGTTELIDIPKDAGTYTLRVNVAETDNYAASYLDITIVINKATPDIRTEPTASPITYGQTLSESTLNGGTAQVSDVIETTVEGTFSWANENTKPTVADSDKTKYNVIFTPKDQNNFNTVNEGIEVSITVNKADHPQAMPGNTMTAANNESTVGDVQLPEGWAWSENDKSKELKEGDTVKATAVYNVSDKDNYLNTTVEVTITKSTHQHTGGTATCVTLAICSTCGQHYGEVNSNNHVNTEVQGRKSATCTSSGYTGDTVCKDCKETIRTGTAIAPTGHSGGTATCVAAAICSMCGQSYGSKDPSNHVSITAGQGKIDATCEKDGYTGDSVCTACNTKTKTGEKIPALGHAYGSPSWSWSGDTSATATVTCTRGCGRLCRDPRLHPPKKRAI